MSNAEQAYLGDEALAGLLKKAGLRVEMSQIRGLLAGVLAAPEGEHPEHLYPSAFGKQMRAGGQLPRDGPFPWCAKFLLALGWQVSPCRAGHSQ